MSQPCGLRKQVTQAIEEPLEIRRKKTKIMCKGKKREKRRHTGLLQRQRLRKERGGERHWHASEGVRESAGSIVLRVFIQFSKAGILGEVSGKDLSISIEYSSPF